MAPNNKDIVEPGTILFGYRVLEFVGEGGWAYVYKAQHPKLPKFVAIKQLKPEWAQDERVLQRFLREANIVARLNHPNVVTIYDLRQDGGTGAHYIVTEFAEKGTLADRLQEFSGGLPIDEVLHIAMGVCGGLEAVHRRSLVHQDVKPSNILMVDVGEGRDIPKLSDFGIAEASALPGMDASVGIPKSSGVYGTLSYMSPEQLDEEVEVDHRSDVYSLGVLLYELLTGQVPFSGEVHDVFWAHMYVSPRPPGELRPDIPEPLAQIVLRALAKDRQDRYPSAAEMHEALRAIEDVSVRRERQQRFRVLLRRGLLHLDKEEWEEAADVLGQADVLDPENEQVQEGLRQAREQQQAKRLYERGTQCLEEEDWEEAQEYFAQVMSYDPDYDGGRARDLLDQATQALERRRKRRTLMVRYRTGLGHFRKGHWAQAIVELEQVLTQDPGFEDAADWLKEARRYVDAERLLEQARRHGEREEWRQAVELLEEVRLLRPPHVDVARELEQARRRWVEAREEHQVAAWYEAGLAHLAAGDLEQARMDFERIVARLPDYRDVRDRLGEIRQRFSQQQLFERADGCEEACDWGGAIGSYRAILDIDPYNRKATRRLSRAQRCADRGGRGGLDGFIVRAESWWNRCSRGAKAIWVVLLGILMVGLCVGAAMAAGLSLPPAAIPTPVPTTAVAVPVAVQTPTSPPTSVPTETDIPSATPKPTSTPTLTPSPIPWVQHVDCVGDRTVPDRPILVPGMPFTRSWGFASTTVGRWPEGSKLVFVEGNQMSGPDEQPVEPLLVSSETFTVSLSLIAPASDGEYEGIWQVQDAEGNPLSDGLTVRVAVFQPPPPTPSYPPPELMGLDVMGCNVTFKWDWPRSLAENDWFAVRAGRAGSGPPHSVAWTKDRTFILRLDEGGDYNWEIAICRGDPAQAVCEQMAVSEQEVFSFGGCSTRPPPPPPPPDG